MEKPVVRAVRVPQWIKAWSVGSRHWDKDAGIPPKEFYFFSLPAKKLQNLSRANTRLVEAGTDRKSEYGTQREVEEDRLGEIKRFIEGGFPYSTLPASLRTSENAAQAIRPGWLPTAVVLNILKPGDERRGGQKLDAADAAKLDKDEHGPFITLPEGSDDLKWRPKPGSLRPFEIIDGQHRLEAAREAAATDDYHIPVVAFNDLHPSWQAYLFWIINIKPKKINRSLAFDLFPLLRSESWLESTDQIQLYRETRAQEIVSILWAHPSSPWHERINMLGSRGGDLTMVTQGSWVRSLVDTFYRSPNSRSEPKGGLFTAKNAKGRELTAFSLAQESAYIMAIGELLFGEIRSADHDWAAQLRLHDPKQTRNRDIYDAAIQGPETLLNRDQGTRAMLGIFNDFSMFLASEMDISEWRPQSEISTPPTEMLVKQEQESLKRTKAHQMMQVLAHEMASFDWRIAAAVAGDAELKRKKAAYLGGPGYKYLRDDVLKHLVVADVKPFSKTATQLLKGA